jgi:hypothetical protein
LSTRIPGKRKRPDSLEREFGQLEWQLEAVARRFYYVESVYASGSGPVKRRFLPPRQDRQDVALAIRVIRRIPEPAKVVVDRHYTHSRSVVALVRI